MKKLFLICMLAGLFLTTATAQTNELERRGYDGDFFSLEGALEMFKQSRNIRDFERKINSRDNWVNNLDLDLDGRTDYVRVEHRRQGRLHAIIMQVYVNRFDVQDVAVIEIEKTGNREAILQIIGDEDLYGEEIIVEPIEGVASSSGSGQYDDQFYDSGNYGNDYVNVYHWRAVNRLFAPDYQVYASPYYYSYYPTWWSPWNTCTWSIFRPRIRHYHRFHHIVYVHRVHHVHTFYRPYRSYCDVIVFRSNEQRVRQGRAPIYRTKDNPNPNRNSVASGTSKPTKQPAGVVNTQSGTKPHTATKPNRTVDSGVSKPGISKPGSTSKAPTSTKPASRPTVSSKAPITASTQSTNSRPKPASTSSRRPSNIDGKYRTSTRSTSASSTSRGSSSDSGISKPSRSSSTQSSATKPSQSSSSTRSSSRESYSTPSRSSSSDSRSSASKPSRSSSSSTRSSSSSSYSKPSRSASSSSRSSASKPSRSSSSSARSSSSSRSSKPSSSSASKSSRSSSSKSSSSRSSSSKGKRGG